MSTVDGHPRADAPSAVNWPSLAKLCIAVALLCAVGVHLTWHFFVFTATGQAIDRAAFEGALIQQSQLWQIARPVLDIVSNTLVALGAVAAVLVALMRRRAWLAAQALMVIVGANVTTQVVKDIYSRPRVLTGWTGQNSLPSGHVTVVAAATVALLLTVPRNWRPMVASLGAVWTLLTGLSTLVGQWHRPADVVAALLVATFWGALACLVGSLRSLDLPDRTRHLGGTWFTIKIISIIAGIATLAALGALLWLYRLGSGTGEGETLANVILQRGELVAYLGGIAAVCASVFGCFGLMLLLRNLTLNPLLAKAVR